MSLTRTIRRAVATHLPPRRPAPRTQDRQPRKQALVTILDLAGELARGWRTPPDLAVALGVSERTLRRYVVALVEAGVPVERRRLGEGAGSAIEWRIRPAALRHRFGI